RLKTVRNAPEKERIKRAATYLAVAGMRAADVPMPKDIRVSNRYFEEQSPAVTSTLLEDIDKLDPNFLPLLKRNSPEIFSKLTSFLNQATQAQAPQPGTALAICAGGGQSGTYAYAGTSVA